MDFLGSYFEYSGKDSRMYDLIFVNANTEQFLSLNGETQSNIVFNRQDKRNYYIGESFEDSPIKFEAEIITYDGTPIDRFMRREIEKWLFHQPTYRRLYTDMACDIYGESYELVEGRQKRLYLNCRFVNPQKIEGNGGLVGYRFTVECDSNMAWQDEVTYKYAINNANAQSSKVVKVNVDTDMNDYLYPKVSIVMGSEGGNITISNNTDDATRLTSFVGLTPNITVNMNGSGINYISGDNYLKFSNKNFVRLLDGENYISIIGNVKEISFEFQQRRYL